MYSPCVECFIKYNKKYTEECNNMCDYAVAVRTIDNLQAEIKTLKDDIDNLELCDSANVSEKEIIMNILNRLKLQDKTNVYEDGVIEFFNGWESLIIEFDENGTVKEVH